MPKYQLGTARLSGRETVVLVVQNAYMDLSTLWNAAPVRQALILTGDEQPRSLMQMLDHWSYWRERLPHLVEFIFAQAAQESLPGFINPAELEWLPPLRYPRKLICIGVNYWDHITEMGIPQRPRYPYSFLKPATTTLQGSGASLLLPQEATMVDWEAELAVVIGHHARRVRGTAALACVAGYSILNDISARDWLEDLPPVGVDWVMQKAFDGFAPMGPFITPADCVANPQQLHITLTVNGVLKQDSTTANMVFSVQEIIEHLASIMTLEPGDVIATGSPAGVGYARHPREFLRSGDRMVAAIDGLGVLETPVA